MQATRIHVDSDIKWLLLAGSLMKIYLWSNHKLNFVRVHLK